jgi:hypothetical protein
MIYRTGVYPMTRKSLIVLVAIVALITAGAFAVTAQDDGDNPTPFGPGWMHHQGVGGLRPGMMHGHSMMGRGFGSGMMWGDGEPMMLTVAEALDLEPDAFYAALGDGQTLAQIAEAQGVALETVYNVMLVQAQEHMAEMVDAGYITQEQADEHLAWMRENIAEMPMFSGSGFGPCLGGQVGFGSGMMGRGMRGHHS